jgi:mutator protein MutT
MTQPGKVFKYCPKCGSSEFHFDGDRSFKCAHCKFHFYINSSAAVAVIIENPNGEILLTIRAHNPNKGYLDLPGGFVDPMETAEDAVRREIREELNLEVENMRYLTSFPNEYVFSGFSVYTTDLAFVAQVSDFSGISANDDISGFIFAKPDEVDFSKIGAPSITQIIKTYNKMNNPC